jgi:hypothetical protein
MTESTCHKICYFVSYASQTGIFLTLNSISCLIPVMETERVSLDVVTEFLSVILDRIQVSRF